MNIIIILIIMIVVIMWNVDQDRDRCEQEDSSPSRFKKCLAKIRKKGGDNGKRWLK